MAVTVNSPLGFQKKLFQLIYQHVYKNPLVKRYFPKKWNAKELTTFPRVGIKISQPAPMVWRQPVYSANVVFTIMVKAKADGDDDCEEIAAQIHSDFIADPMMHEQLTNDSVHLFAFESGGIASTTEGEIRQAVVTIVVYACEK